MFYAQVRFLQGSLYAVLGFFSMFLKFFEPRYILLLLVVLIDNVVGKALDGLPLIHVSKPQSGPFINEQVHLANTPWHHY